MKTPTGKHLRLGSPEQIRANADAIDSAMDVLGNTAGIFLNLSQYREIRDRARAYTSAFREIAVQLEAKEENGAD